MPVFVSRFSSNRAASALLQRIRTQPTQADTRATTNTREQRETEETRGSNNTQQQTTRVAETLLARTQVGQQIANRLQEARTNNARSTRDTNTEQQTRTTQTEQQNVRGNTTRENNRTETQPRLQTPPGVGITRSQTDNNTERPGRLDRAPANPIRERVLEGFARLRAIASGILSDRNTRTQSSANANGLTNRTDGRTRFLANNASQAQGRAVGQQATERQTPTIAIQAPVTIQAPSIAQTPRAASATETPTAEEISRANTTEEIRNNLQQDAGEIARGLTRDGTRQLQKNTQQTAQNAERTAESQRSETQTEGREEIRELQTQERDLSRELQQTQQDLRQERLRVQRAQSPASQSTTSSAAAIGSNVNILAG